MQNKKRLAARFDKTIISWQEFQSVNGTLEEWVKKSDAEFAAIDDEIQEIRELLDDND
jgi:hypothetical protein